MRELDAWSRRERGILAVLIVALLGTAVGFRLMHLSSIPGINGDEGWWGVQALAWLNGQPYEARTTSGNPIDMLYLVPLGLTHELAPPSFALLRALPAAANLLALVLGFWLVRRLYGTTAAWIQTIALAIAPTAIAHSRFCQDPSQSILWTSIVIYLSLLGLKEHRHAWRYFIAALVLFPVALWTHPTNVFIGPFLALPLYAAIKPLVPASPRGRRIFIGVAVVVVALAVIAGVLVLQRSAGSNVFLDKPWLAIAADRVTSGGQWFEFVRNYGRLFSGVTIYRYFSGPQLLPIAYSVGVIAVAVGAAWGLRLAFRHKRSALDYGLVLAWAAMLLIYFAFAGPESIRPHVERWGLCLIVPATLVVARAVAAWIEVVPAKRWLTIGAAALVATGLLGSFYLNYFREFETSGGRSHHTFVTAGTEPKQQALERIVATTPGTEPVMILATQWWHYWPIKYLATRHPHVTVSMSLAVEDRPEFREALTRGRLFLVEFVGSQELVVATDWIRKHGLQATSTTIEAASGRKLFEILHVAPAPSIMNAK